MALKADEIEEFNLKRQAIQNTVTWEFEMWRRQTQAAWEIEQQEREQTLKAELEKQLEEKKQQIDDKKLKDNLQVKQKQLQDLILKCQTESKTLNKLKEQLIQEQKNAQTEYAKQCQIIENKYKSSKNQILAKANAMSSKQKEMHSRSEYFKEQWSTAEERLRDDQKIMDERRRGMMMVSEDDLLQQLENINRTIDQQEQEKQYLEKCKQDLYQQYLRGVQLCKEIKEQQLLEQLSNDEDEEDEYQ